MRERSQHFRLIVLPVLGISVLLLLAAPAMGQNFDLGLMPGGDMGRFSIGAGAYQAPNDAISDSGLYGLVRYEIDQFEFEIDYGLTDQQFFLGAADYLFNIPTAEGVTQTAVAIGGGLTFVNNDPVLDDSKIGPNLLAQVRFMDTLAVQLRYDWLGEDASLWTFGLSYSFF